MKLYRSVMERFSGFPTTQICVLAKTDNKTIEQGFGEMLDYLASKQIGVVDVVKPTISVLGSDGIVYILANQRKPTRTGYIYSPSNLLRHVFCTDFTLESLYYDENGDVVDLTSHAMRDWEGQRFAAQMNFKQNLWLNPNLVWKILYLEQILGLHTDPHVHEYTRYIKNNHPLVTTDDYYFRIMRRSYMKGLLQIMENSNALKAFLKASGILVDIVSAEQTPPQVIFSDTELDTYLGLDLEALPPTLQSQALSREAHPIALDEPLPMPEPPGARIQNALASRANETNRWETISTNTTRRFIPRG